MKQLSNYAPVIGAMHKFFLKDVEFENDLSEILEAHDRLVIAPRHGSPLSWLPVIAAMAQEASDQGYTDRVPVGVFDRRLYQVPIFEKLVSYLAPDAPTSYEELLELMSRLHKADAVIFPEGSNCFFGYPDQVRDFRSTRFIELAIELEIPILLVNHVGSEDWVKSVDVSGKHDLVFSLFSSFLPTAFVRSKILGLPKFPKPIEKFRLWFEVYHPQVSKENLSSTEAGRTIQIEDDVKAIREFYQL